jgi:hypothetical protein
MVRYFGVRRSLDCVMALTACRRRTSSAYRTQSGFSAAITFFRFANLLILIHLVDAYSGQTFHRPKSRNEIGRPGPVFPELKKTFPDALNPEELSAAVRQAAHIFL